MKHTQKQNDLAVETTVRAWHSCLVKMRDAHRLKAEADALLETTGLMAILANYGEVYPTGSYLYDLMTWRDLDLCVATEAPDVASAFRLGAEIAANPLVGAMYFRNEFVLKTEGNPEAMFLCVEYFPPKGGKWKVDILISTPDVVDRVLQPGRDLLARITAETRRAILQIKSALTTRPEYRREYGSREIYRAVLDDGVRNLEQWKMWLEK
ncbi:hypothetical protein ACFL6M_01250 [Candidatus Eisenbacteria bacterium]|uniref:Nucleotidyltransferase family protein n=1 Tax=Eiseniibacteriota bacterium TaxID=2212470 RepID=A0ABV6YIM7_UNCEI